MNEVVRVTLQKNETIETIIGLTQKKKLRQEIRIAYLILKSFYFKETRNSRAISSHDNDAINRQAAAS